MVAANRPPNRPSLPCALSASASLPSPPLPLPCPHSYIKLGQFIASSPTLFPEEYVLEFQKCLDSTEPVPFEIIRCGLCLKGCL